MASSFEHFARDVMSGVRTGIVPSLLRGLMNCAEPIYTGAMRTRNRLFDRGLKRAIDLGRPTISIGNITTGGTGKTPAVAWLFAKLRESGQRPAVLMRGYKSQAGQSDEQMMLQSILGSDAIIIANPDRVAGAKAALERDSAITHFILDDGFQHRRARRNFDLVLINARAPFGFGRVFPRGLLREPLEGLSRADAFLITHASVATPEIEQTLRRYNPKAPIYQSEHVVTSLKDASGKTYAFNELKNRPAFAFAGIGDPQSFEQSLRLNDLNIVGTSWLSDHARYSAPILKELTACAKSCSAQMMVTTEKDWVKILPIGFNGEPEILRAQVEIRFSGNDNTELLNQILRQTSSPLK